MVNLDVVVSQVIQNLKRRGKLEGVRLSSSHGSEGTLISKIDELEGYLNELTDLAYLRGVSPPKESWHQLNGIWRPIANAAVIELCKYLPYLPGFDKNTLYRAIGIKIGENTTIAPRVQFDYFHPELIEIGSNCIIGDGVGIWTHTAGIDFFMLNKVTIGDYVRVGGYSIIVGPTRIGDHTTINLGAVVSGEVPPNSKVRGREISKWE